jgi:hypothetical protein
MKTSYTKQIAGGLQISLKNTRIMEFMLIHSFLWWRWWHMKRLTFTGYETTWKYETENFSESINLN